MTLPDDLTAALRPVIDTFVALNIDYFITGSVASSVFGAVRATNDIDIVASISSLHVRPITERLHSKYYIDRQSISDAVRLHRSFNVVHLSTAFKIDIFVCTGAPTDKLMFSRARTIQFGNDDNSLEVRVASPEDLILAKLRWYEEGGRASNQQLLDIQGILRVQSSIDHKYLEVRASELGLTELLNIAII